MCTWLKNMLGIPGWSASEDQMAKIWCPYLELGVHVTYKTVETYSILGAWIVAPAYKFLRRNKFDSHVLRLRSRRLAGGFLVFGAAIGPILTYARIKGGNLNQDEVYDRAYRLRYNVDQVNVDRWVTIAAPLTFLATRSLYGSMCAINAAVLGAAVYNKYGRAAPKPPKEPEVQPEVTEEKKPE